MPSPDPSPLPPPVESPQVPAAMEGHVPLRLSVAGGGLGIEVYEPVEVGPLEVRRLAYALPGLKFPLDLGAGVQAFRHRRGDLTHVALRIAHARLASWIATHLGDVLGPRSAPVRVWPVPHGLSIGVCAEQGVLAFELLWAPTLADARWVVHRVRGAGFEGPALGHALRAVEAVLAPTFTRRGRLLTLADAGARIGRAVLPAVGTRVPAAQRVRFSELSHDAGGSEVALSSDLAQAALAPEVVRALELAELCQQADEALARGAVDEARAEYLGLLERAPRHPELTRLVAEIDCAVPARAEAALGLLAETGVVTEGGAAAAELLLLLGDTDGARAALRHEIDAEAYGPIAALRLVQVSELCDGIRERLAVLDEAVARSPLLETPRWRRLALRLDVGDVEAALSDAAHLEAAACGARARHEVCLRAARAFLDVGFVRDAGKLFERALRYVPDDAGATAGLARSLIEVGRAERAYALLSRAVELSERTGRADSDALLDMAHLLAERLGDLPGAVARAREVPAGAPRVLEARFLEAEWRRRLGDVDGASVAFSRLRDAIELSDAPTLVSVKHLAEAARFERNARDDLALAERHLAVALQKAPNDVSLLAEYRDVAAALSARRREAEHDDTPTTPPVGY